MVKLINKINWIKILVIKKRMIITQSKNGIGIDQVQDPYI